MHSVVFAGFSATALRDRLIASKSVLLITCDVGKRGGKTLPLQVTANFETVKTETDHCVPIYIVTDTAALLKHWRRVRYTMCSTGAKHLR
jgi:acetyl-CoA synthetase